MRILAICNQKGGTGKTATAVNLGPALAVLGKKVLLIDLDPQANASYTFDLNGSAGSIVEVLQGKQTLQAMIVNKEKINIIPSHRALADLELALISKIGREMILKRSLAEIHGYDFVIIDCPPSLSILTIAALAAARELIIPLQAEPYSIKGLTELLATVREIRREINESLKVLGILFTMYDARRGLSEEVVKAIRDNFKERIFKTTIRENVRIAESPSYGQSVLTYAPDSHGAEDYKALAKEIL